MVFLFLLGSLPSGIGIEPFHRPGDCFGAFAQILLKDNSVRAYQESLHTGGPIFSRICHEGESTRHPSRDDVALRSAASILSLTIKDVEEVTPIWDGRAFTIAGISLGHCLGHERSDRTLRLAFSYLPVEAVVLPFLAEDLLRVFMILLPEFLFCRCQLPASLNGRHFIKANPAKQDFLLSRLGIEIPDLALVNERYGARPILVPYIQSHRAVAVLNETVPLLVAL